jgi:hypothetical protein
MILNSLLHARSRDLEHFLLNFYLPRIVNRPPNFVRKQERSGSTNRAIEPVQAPILFQDRLRLARRADNGELFYLIHEVSLAACET